MRLDREKPRYMQATVATKSKQKVVPKRDSSLWDNDSGLPISPEGDWKAEIGNRPLARRVRQWRLHRKKVSASAEWREWQPGPGPSSNSAHTWYSPNTKRVGQPETWGTDRVRHVSSCIPIKCKIQNTRCFLSLNVSNILSRIISNSFVKKLLWCFCVLLMFLLTTDSYSGQYYQLIADSYPLARVFPPSLLCVVLPVFLF